MAKTLQSKATAVALAIDRTGLAELIGKLLAKRQGRRVAEADSFMQAPFSQLEAEAKDDAFSSAPVPAPKRRRPRRGELNFKKVKLVISDIWSADLRYGSKRYKKLEFVIAYVTEREEQGRTVWFSDLLGRIYDHDTYEKLDAHDLNGMVERGHIKLED